MVSRVLSIWKWICFSIIVFSLVTGNLNFAAEPAKSVKKWTSLQRMERAQLKAVHDDVEQIKSRRKTIAMIPGLNDYRAILHAHAEDSAHTGGTRLEMLAEAKKAGVNAIFLSDHDRPPKDFITESWSGLHEGVLFVPGAEARGFLLVPLASIMSKLAAPTSELVSATTADGGLIFLSHIEERVNHDMVGLTGLEIYNRHYDAKNDTVGILALVLKMTSTKSIAELEESLRLYPDEFFAFDVEYPSVYLAKWDLETATRRLTGVAANDCHHNQILIVKVIDAENVRVGTNVDRDDQMRSVSAKIAPGIRELTKDRQSGDVIARVDLDPYHRSFRNVSTHVLAPELTEEALRSALRQGHAYVSHDWMCDATGFRFGLQGALKPQCIMGDEVKLTTGMKLEAQFPVDCTIRLLRGGKVIAEQLGDHFVVELNEPGVYRVEGWLTLDGETRGWIYANPIYVR